MESHPMPVYQPGSAKIHLGRRAGTYASGRERWLKACGTNRNDRYLPTPAPDAEITCKRCLAKLA